MDTKPLESFAKAARRELIAAVSAQASAVLAPGSVARTERAGTVRRLEADIVAHGHEHVIHKVAYTWFNRLIALRFMDAKGYTTAGVVSPMQGKPHGQPEILADAKRGDIDADVVTSSAARGDILGLLDGTRRSTDAEGEAYALLLTEYCRHWHKSMPFMFGREGDYTELLVPAGLLAEGGIVARVRNVLAEDVCDDVEVIGWLYQFYISERKDEVFADFKKKKKAVAADIPAATQLFTPHWIVRYLVDNSLGRLWMLNRPSSRLVDRMDYYIKPVQHEADFIRVSSPEDLTILDPACGSGHMLTYAFDLLYAIYEEEGYAPSEIPSLILAHNVHGAEIDVRAGALAAFALFMKARARDRRFLARGVAPKICVIEPVAFAPDEIDFLTPASGDRKAAEAFWNQFRNADVLGSLIRPDVTQTAQAAALLPTLEEGLLHGETLHRARQVVWQAETLGAQYDVVVANPPYMGSSNMDGVLDSFVRETLPDSKADLFATFIDRAQYFAAPSGLIAMIAKQNWLFRPTFSTLRSKLLSSNQLEQVVHFGAGAFDSLSGEVASTAAFVMKVNDKRGGECWFARLVEGENEAAKERGLRDAIYHGRGVHRRTLSEFLKIPGAPVCYWISDSGLSSLAQGPYLGDVLNPRQGLVTGDNARFLRLWWEVSTRSTYRGATSREEARASGRRWFPYNKGGGARRWYGHDEHVVDWFNDGQEIQTTLHPSGNRIRATNFNLDFIFREAVTWSDITSRGLALRFSPAGFLFDATGLCAFPRAGRETMLTALALVNSTYGSEFADLLNPTHHFKPGDFARLPLPSIDLARIETLVNRAVEISRADWLTRETAPGFTSPQVDAHEGSLARWLSSVEEHWDQQTTELSQIEQILQGIVGVALNGDEYEPTKIERSSITLFSNPYYEHSSSSDPKASAVHDSVLRLVSYAVGCMFGRYSLDLPGLILADQGSTLQDYLAKIPVPRFRPDADNVIPFVDDGWFEDDIVERFRQFLRAAFGAEYFEENLRFVEESLGVKTLRDYFITKTGKSKFYDDHVRRYKQRPIYWMFSSPKGSFNALVYLHRYTPSTASTVLNEYLREYEAKLTVALQQCETAAVGGESAKDQKEAARIRKVLAELRDYEHDVLYPLATRQVAIDLDDGVKANYPKLRPALKKIAALEASDG